MRPDFGLDDDDADAAGDDDAAGEQDLLLVFRLSNRLMGTNQERQALQEIGDELEAAVTAAGVGEYDGDEFGGGECTLFFCGPDVDKLLAVLRPLLRRSPFSRGAQIVRMVADADGEWHQQRSNLLSRALAAQRHRAGN